MAKLDLASSEWCQLIFEGKNQAYGAYRMRANSTKRHNVDCSGHSSGWI